MVIGEFLGIAIIGALLSLAMQFIKKWSVGSEINAKAMVLILSIIVGGIYYWVRDTSWWEPMLGILMSSSTVYALLIHKSK